MTPTARSLVLGTSLALVVPTASVVAASTTYGAAVHRTTTAHARSAYGDDPKNRPGAGALKVRLTNLPDGRIRVHWKGKGPRKNFKPWKIRVATDRAMDADVRVYHVKGKRRSTVVNPAADVTPASGDYTFVKIKARRKHGLKGGGSPTKWIQAPVTATPTGSDRVIIGTFNVRDADLTTGTPSWATWDKRKQRVFATIRSSGAGIVNLQEASGSSGAGPLHQAEEIAAGTGMTLVDPSLFSASGRTGGKQGTRILYNANAYSVLDKGAQMLPSGYWLEWAEFQEKATGKRFFDISMHLSQGTAPANEQTRAKEGQSVIALARALATRDGSREVFLAGDSNSTNASKPKGLVHRQFVKAGFYDAFATKTITGQKFPTTNQFRFPVKPGPFRRDVIMSFHGPLGSFWYHNLAYTSQSQVASDHFMQVAQLPLG